MLRGDASSAADRPRRPTDDVARRELALFAVAARARCPDRGADAERIALLAELHAAGLDLARQLREHTLHSMADCRGSHSAWNVVAESEALSVAEERYATVARRAAARLPAILPGTQGSS